jgi:hypothetical protein
MLTAHQQTLADRAFSLERELVFYSEIYSRPINMSEVGSMNDDDLEILLSETASVSESVRAVIETVEFKDDKENLDYDWFRKVKKKYHVVMRFHAHLCGEKKQRRRVRVSEAAPLISKDLLDVEHYEAVWASHHPKQAQRKRSQEQRERMIHQREEYRRKVFYNSVVEEIGEEKFQTLMKSAQVTANKKYAVR